MFQVNADATFFSERDTVQLRLDLADAEIYICAPEVLLLFSDNFDYQMVRRDFITGVLSEEELGNKLYIHELENECVPANEFSDLKKLFIGCFDPRNIIVYNKH